MKKIYGRDATRLVLTKKAQEFYNGTEPFVIYEHETDDGYRYSFKLADDPVSDLMTAEQLNQALESMADCFDCCD